MPATTTENVTSVPAVALCALGARVKVGAIAAATTEIAAAALVAELCALVTTTE